MIPLFLLISSLLTSSLFKEASSIASIKPNGNYQKTFKEVSPRLKAATLLTAITAIHPQLERKKRISIQTALAEALKRPE